MILAFHFKSILLSSITEVQAINHDCSKMKEG